MSDLAAAASDAIAGDDQIRSRVSGLVNLALDAAEKDLKTGTPATRQGVLKVLMPSLVKVLGEESNRDEVIDEIRAEQRVLYNLLQQTVASGPAPVPEPDPVEDAPPRKKAPRRGS